MAQELEIIDIACLRAIPAAIPANPGSIALENILGAVSLVTDQGAATPIGGVITAIAKLKRGTDLTDADQNISPGVDKASEYWQVTSTADRIKTLQNASMPTSFQARFINLSANNVTIKNQAGTTLVILAPASGAAYQGADMYYSGSAWSLSVGWFFTT